MAETIYVNKRDKNNLLYPKGVDYASMSDKYSNRDYTNTFADQAAKKLGLDGVDDYPILNDIEFQVDAEKTMKNNFLAQVGLRAAMKKTGGDLSKLLQNFLATDTKEELNKTLQPRHKKPAYEGDSRTPDQRWQDEQDTKMGTLTATGTSSGTKEGTYDYNTRFVSDPSNPDFLLNPKIRIKLSELADSDSAIQTQWREVQDDPNATAIDQDGMSRLDADGNPMTNLGYMKSLIPPMYTPLSQANVINHELSHFAIIELYNTGRLGKRALTELRNNDSKIEHEIIDQMTRRGLKDDPIYKGKIEPVVTNETANTEALDNAAKLWLKDNSPPVREYDSSAVFGEQEPPYTTPYTGKLPGRIRDYTIEEEKYDGAIPAGLAKGGDIMPMEQQMEMFGSDPMGGLDDDGMSRDPVSGNEIPPGSMANEVRDDVDAKLSDGEYVVPANVVRFFGVKFFEDLRSQAMQGLSAMEANGRIGGEPVPAEMPMQDQMAGAASELTEQDMAMLQGMMNEGGYVQGYNHGGLHDPVTDKAIPQSVPSSVYPVNQFITPGASTISSALNPYVAPSAGTPKPTTPAVGSDATVRYVTYVKPGSGEIRVIAFRGDTPVNPDEVTSALQAGYFPQGSDELAEYQRDANRNPEDDWNVQDGSKPPNKMTVGELAWSLTRTTYAAGNPDSFTAGFGNLVGKGLGTGVMKSVLGNVPSDAEIYIKTAQNRLKTNNYSNAKEKEILEGIANQSGVAMGLVNKNMVALTGINFKLGKEKGKDIPFNNRVPDYSTSRAQKKAAQLIEETKDMKGVSDDVKTALDDDGSDYGADYYYDYKKDPAYIASNKAKKNAEVKATATTEDNNNTVSTPSRSFDPNDSGMGAAVAEKEKASDKAAKSAGATRSRGGSREFGMNKGGLLKKPTKKKTKK